MPRRYPRNKFGVRTDRKGIEDRTADGVVFHSKKECLRYKDLKLLERSGEITRLRLQPEFIIMVNGFKICKYIGDFVYHDRNGKEIIEDSKGVLTPEYRLKKKLMYALYKIDILET